MENALKTILHRLTLGDQQGDLILGRVAHSAGLGAFKFMTSGENSFIFTAQLEKLDTGIPKKRLTNAGKTI